MGKMYPISYYAEIHIRQKWSGREIT